MTLVNTTFSYPKGSPDINAILSFLALSSEDSIQSNKCGALVANNGRISMTRLGAFFIYGDANESFGENGMGGRNELVLELCILLTYAITSFVVVMVLMMEMRTIKKRWATYLAHLFFGSIVLLEPGVFFVVHVFNHNTLLSPYWSSPKIQEMYCDALGLGAGRSLLHYILLMCDRAIDVALFAMLFQAARQRHADLSRELPMVLIVLIELAVVVLASHRFGMFYETDALAGGSQDNEYVSVTMSLFISTYGGFLALMAGLLPSLLAYLRHFPSMDLLTSKVKPLAPTPKPDTSNKVAHEKLPDIKTAESSSV